MSKTKMESDSDWSIPIQMRFDWSNMHMANPVKAKLVTPQI